MTDFRRTCRQCFIERGQTILLVKQGDKWVCPVNPEHKTNDDIQVA